jgi:uncharacterized protein YbaR (Trm112 family)
MGIKMLKKCPRCEGPLELLRILKDNSMTLKTLWGGVQRTFVDVLYCPRCGYPDW